METKETEARRLLNKYAAEILSVREAGDIIIRVAKIADESQAIIDTKDAQVAEREAKIAQHDETLKNVAASESISRTRAEAAARDVQEKEALGASLDSQIKVSQETLDKIKASIEEHKKLFSTV